MLPLVIAHRGDSAHAPENTRAAFERAARLGADWIETDLQLAADGVVVAFHDDTLPRLTGAGGSVRDHASTSLVELEVRHPAEGGGSDRNIPLLEDILDGVGQQIPFYLELKTNGKGRADPHNAALLQRCLEMVPPDSHHALASFDADLVRACLERDRRTVYIFDGESALDALRRDELARLYALSAHHGRLSRDLYARLRELGPLVWVWTVDGRHDLERVTALGVDGVCTNDVGSTRRLLQRAQP